jgi:hypothetical protein
LSISRLANGSTGEEPPDADVDDKVIEFDGRGWCDPFCC